MTNPFRALSGIFAHAGRVVLAVATQGAVTILLVPAIVAPTTLVPSSSAYAQCAENQVQNHTGLAGTPCPCFVPGEEAGVVLSLPAGTFPIHITKVGIAWQSQVGGQPQSLEQAFHIYPAGLPNPGVPIFTQLGPQMTDGAINEFNIEALDIIVPSGPFSLTLEFLNQSAGNVFAPSVMYDLGCQPGKNLVKVIPGGWNDACLLGVPGDWIMYVKYKECSPTGIGDERILSSVPVYLRPAAPNPFTSSTQLEFFLQDGGNANVSVYDVRGRQVAQLANQFFPAGTNYVSWDGTGRGDKLASGVYFVELRSAGEKSVRKVTIKN